MLSFSGMGDGNLIFYYMYYVLNAIHLLCVCEVSVVRLNTVQNEFKTTANDLDVRL